MDTKRLNLLKELTEASGVPGYETEIRGILKKHLSPVGSITQDNLGGIVCEKKGQSNSPRIIIPAHMDEVGFIVKHITEEGFILFGTLGGWWMPVVLAQQVEIKTGKGGVIGVIGSKPPHILSEEERKRPLEIKNMFIDVGAGSKKEVQEDLGINLGDPVIPICKFTEMKNKKYLLAKAWDDRVGCGMMIDVMKNLKSIKHPNTVYGAGTVQEEVGLRGAKTAAFMVKPDVAIVAETGIASDVYGARPEEMIGRLNKGPQICLHDAGMIPNIKLRDLAIATAKKHKIPYQLSFLSAGRTDGAEIHVSSGGVPSLYIGVPARYIHGYAGMIYSDDYDHAVNLVTELVKVLDKDTVKKLVE